MRSHASALAALALGTFVCSAAATAISSARLSNTALTLIDLDPFDGISPSITFDQATQGIPEMSSLFLSGYSNGPETGDDFTYRSESMVSPFEPLELTGFDGRAYARITNGGSSFDGHALEVAGATPGGYWTVGSYSADITTPAGFVANFVLSPYTLLVVTADATLHASNTVATGISWYHERSSARAAITIRGYSSNASQGGILSEYRDYAELFNDDTILHRRELNLSRQLTATFANFTTETLRGSVQMNVRAEGYSPLSTIPEPSGYGLAFVATGVCTLLRRRKPGRWAPAPH